jgi:peptide/nickel transport system ATP-binding protein/oligopeptide transport system ATP-binding protein
MDKLVEIKGLSTAFLFDGVLLTVVNNIDMEIYKGEILGIVGESGSGKSVTARSIMRLIQEPPGKILGGQILYEGKNIFSYTEKEMQSIRGNRISMIFQEPMTSLNPVYTCGEQIIEAIILHKKVPRHEARIQAIELLKLVGITLPEVRIDNYPHELSGGMRQRIVIAMALSCNPQLLIADEPTTALDPTIQAQILELIRNLQKTIGMTVLYITHDLGVVAELCQRVIVMYGGRIMEKADVFELFNKPMHPYTRGLMQAMPKIDENKERLYNIEGTVPHFSEMPSGCPFCTRCPEHAEKCRNERPEAVDVGNNHFVSCFRVKQGGN